VYVINNRGGRSRLCHRMATERLTSARKRKFFHGILPVSDNEECRSNRSSANMNSGDQDELYGLESKGAEALGTQSSRGELPKE
jgi:hypothetical protein